MKTIYPEYFNKFSCIADQCPDTCCAGWDVVIDEKFQSIYKSSNTTAAKKAVERMFTDSDGDVCLKLTNGRCPMLNRNNLCEIYIDMGKDALCDVCRIYPRFFKEADGYIIGGISLSCPEAAKLILGGDSIKPFKNLDFVQNEGEKIYFEIYNHLVNFIEQGKFFDCDFKKLEYACDEFVFNRDNFSANLIDKCFKNSVTYSTDFARGAANKISALEILTDEWKKLCKKFKCYAKSEPQKEADRIFAELSNTKEIKSIAVYLLYKYLWEAIGDRDVALWIKRAYGITRLVCELCLAEKLATQSFCEQRLLRIAQLVSKEIEHNEDNLFLFEDFCIEFFII